MKLDRYGEAGDYAEPTRKLDPLVYRLRKARYDTGISQPVLAKKMGYGVKNLKNVESGVQQPSYFFLQTWAQALGFKVELVANDEA